MSHSDEVSKAILAHSKWKQRLRDAIASGSSEFSADQIAVDNRCDFGKWFYSLPVGVRESEQGKKIQKLHATFHAEAARILSLALKGSKTEAMNSMALGSKFMNTTNELTVTLGDWKETIG